MSLKSYIYMKENTGMVKGVYCHRNGELDGVGQCLYENYHDDKKLAELIGLGNLAELGDSLEETVAYIRDRHEYYSENQAIEYQNEDEIYQMKDYFIPYQYLYDVETFMWYVFIRNEQGIWEKHELYDVLVQEEAFE